MKQVKLHDLLREILKFSQQIALCRIDLQGHPQLQGIDNRYKQGIDNNLVHLIKTTLQPWFIPEFIYRGDLPVQ